MIMINIVIIMISTVIMIIMITHGSDGDCDNCERCQGLPMHITAYHPQTMMPMTRTKATLVMHVDMTMTRMAAFNTSDGGDNDADGYCTSSLC